MKLLITLSLTFIALSTSVGSWKDYDVLGQEKDPIIQKLLDFGLKSFLPLAIEEKSLPQSDWWVDKVNSIESQTVSGMNYKFDVILKDSKESLAEAKWVINYQGWKDQAKLLSWDVKEMSQSSPDSTSHVDLSRGSLFQETGNLMLIVDEELQKATKKLQENDSQSLLGVLALSLSSLGKKIASTHSRRSSSSASAQMIEFAMQNSGKGLMGAWQVESTELTPDLNRNLNVCLVTISQKESGLSLTQAQITDVYLHFTKVVTGMMHKVTFRTQNEQGAKLVQVTYLEKPWAVANDRLNLDSYVVLDSTAEFKTIEDPATLNAITKAVEDNMRIIKPEVISNVKLPYMAADNTEVNGQQFFYLNAMIEGTDNMISRYEFWFNNPSTAGPITSDTNLFAYVKLDINKESMQRRGDLAKITRTDGTVDCSSISSYFMCSAYSNCNTQNFIAQSVCLPAQ